MRSKARSFDGIWARTKLSSNGRGFSRKSRKTKFLDPISVNFLHKSYILGSWTVDFQTRARKKWTALLTSVVFLVAVPAVAESPLLQTGHHHRRGRRGGDGRVVAGRVVDVHVAAVGRLVRRVRLASRGGPPAPNTCCCCCRVAVVVVVRRHHDPLAAHGDHVVARRLPHHRRGGLGRQRGSLVLVPRRRGRRGQRGRRTVCCCCWILLRGCSSAWCVNRMSPDILIRNFVTSFVSSSPKVLSTLDRSQLLSPVNL